MTDSEVHLAQRKTTLFWTPRVQFGDREKIDTDDIYTANGLRHDSNRAKPLCVAIHLSIFPS